MMRRFNPIFQWLDSHPGTGGAILHWLVWSGFLYLIHRFLELSQAGAVLLGVLYLAGNAMVFAVGWQFDQVVNYKESNEHDLIR
jgi:hypothetical protein